jgi:hypothetical protein
MQRRMIVLALVVLANNAVLFFAAPASACSECDTEYICNSVACNEYQSATWASICRTNAKPWCAFCNEWICLTGPSSQCEWMENHESTLWCTYRDECL